MLLNRVETTAACAARVYNIEPSKAVTLVFFVEKMSIVFFSDKVTW
jgi:hypothetical protein